MAPALRTYTRKKPEQRNSVDAVNALFVANLYMKKTESGKPKGTTKTKGVKRWGQADSSPLLDPFDAVLRTKNYNNVVDKRTIINESATDTSKEASVSIKDKTLDRPVEESLEIESEHKKQVVDETLNITRVTDHKPTITSTPANPESNFYSEDILTPIKINKFPIDQSALNESLKEIEEWNYKLPVFKDDKKSTKRKGRPRVLRYNIQKAKVKTDWKLRSIPKVVIDKITIEEPKSENFKSSINVSLDEFEKFYKSVSENSLPPIVESDCQSEDGCVHDSRFITKRVLRKRSKTTHVDSLSISNKKSRVSDNSSESKSILNDTSIQNNFSILHGSDTFKPLTSTPYVNKDGQRIFRKRSLTVNLSSDLSQDLSDCKILRSGRIIDNSSTSSNISKNKSENAKKRSKRSKYQFDDSSNIFNNLTDSKSYLSRAKSMSCLEAISAIEKPQKMRKTPQNSTDNFQRHSMRTRSKSTYRESRQEVNSPPKKRLRRSKSVYLDTSELSQKNISNSTSQMSEKQKKPYFLRTQSMYNLQDISSSEKTQNTCKTNVASCENSRDSFNTSPICGRSRSVNRDPRKHSCSFSNQRLIRSKSLILNRPETCDYSEASIVKRKCFVDLFEPSLAVEKSMHCLQDSSTEDIWDMCNSEVASYQDSSFKTQPIRRRPCSTNYETRKKTSLKPRLRRSKSFYIDTTQCDYSSTSMVMRSGRVLPNTLVNSERLRDIIGISDSNLTDSNIVKDSFNNIERNSFSAIEQSYSINNSQNSFHGQNNTCSSQVQNSISNDAVSDIDKTNETNTGTGKHITVRRKVHLEKFPNIYVDFHKSTEDSNALSIDSASITKETKNTSIANYPNCSSKSIFDSEFDEHFVASALSIDSASTTKGTKNTSIASVNGYQTNLGQSQIITQSSENPNCSSKSIFDSEFDEQLVASALSIDFASTTKEPKNTSKASVNGYQSNLKNCTQSSENLSDFSKSIFDYDTDEDLLSDTDGLAISTSTKRAEDISIESLKNIKIVDVCSLTKDKVNTPVVIETSIETLPVQRIKNLKTGKDWRRSLAYRKKSLLQSACQRIVCIETNNCACPKCIHVKLLDQSVCRKSVRVVLDGTPQTENRRISLIETYATAKGYVPENFVREVALGKLLEDLPVSQNVTRHHREGDAKKEFFVSAKDIVLRRCHQTEVVPFEECYPPSVLKNCHKIGEGVYGEVFLFRNKTGSTSVMKVIPIEGDLIVNGERQKKYEEILSEIVIAMELSDLRSNKKNNTSGFSEVRNVHCVQGKYPDQLLDLWNLYDEDRGSENECPEVFDEKQLYIILELANGGKDLESFVFANAKQAYSLFKQAACSLAVAEVELQFEHRDLHWGNILISPIDKNNEETYVINGREIRVPSNGVQISIIDFTLSRINFDGVCIYNDLSVDPDLFNADGDYQFEIYRLMQKRNGNNWQAFEPYTNILWLHYILDKMIYGLRYKPRLPKFHQVYIDKMKELKDQILEYKSVEEFVTHNFV